MNLLFVFNISFDGNETSIHLLKDILIKYLPIENFNGVRFGNPYRELDIMKEEDEKLNNWLMYSINSIQRRKRDRIDINLGSYFKSFEESWKLEPWSSERLSKRAIRSIAESSEQNQKSKTKW